MRTTSELLEVVKAMRALVDALPDELYITWCKERLYKILDDTKDAIVQKAKV